ncbi:MAG: homocysteine S-methyltransferase family protein, partial [Acidobacteriota bacterium]
DQFDELAALAASLARRAADRAGAAVAGSLPPLNESYRPDLVPSSDVARPIYRALAMALEPDVDLFLCETMSSVQEARNAAIEAVEVSLRGRRQPVYVSFTLGDAAGSGLRSGESIESAIGGLADLPIAGVLLNCSPPESLEAGLEELRSLSDVRVGCYANRMAEVPDGWTLDNDLIIDYREDLSSALLAQWARRCVERGAEIIGGCCGVSPRDIAVVVETLRSARASR